MDRGHPGSIVDRSHLAERPAGPDESQYLVGRPVVALGDHFEGARAPHVVGVAVLALAHHALAVRHLDRLGHPGQLAEHRGRQVVEEGLLVEEPDHHTEHPDRTGDAATTLDGPATPQSICVRLT